MLLRLWFLVLCVLAGAFASPRADARAAANHARQNEVAGQKLAPGVFESEAAILRQAATMQAAETQQAASSLGYDFASGRCLAPERTAISHSPYQTPYRPGLRNQPDPSRSIDTRSIQNPAGYTAEGFPRDNLKFWEAWASRSPEMISDTNRKLMQGINPRTGKRQRPISPMIDDTWIKYNPHHAANKGDTLIHHHALQLDDAGVLKPGPYAFPVPSSTHLGTERVWHGPFVD